MKNMTNTIVFYCNAQEEIAMAKAGKALPGIQSMNFCSWRMAAKWLKSRAGRKLVDWAAGGVTWAEADGSGKIIEATAGNFDQAKERLFAKAEEILASKEIKALDEEYLNG